LQDTGSVLASRFILLDFKQSFFGREDEDLREKKLGPELPGIANRCLAAYRELCKRGRFVQPESAAALAKRIEARTNPYAAFMQDCWIIDQTSEGPTVGKFYGSFEGWCETHNMLPLVRSTPKNQLARKVKDIKEFFWLKSSKPHGEPRRYPGLRRRDEDEV
jgi:putative DNA primase/helicase